MKFQKSGWKLCRASSASHVAVAAGLVLSMTGFAQAACYAPGDQIEMSVPFAPGGGTDTIARFISPFMAKELGVNIQVVNQRGGNGILAANHYANREEPNGKTLLFLSVSTMLPAILGQQGVQYKFEDFTPVVGLPQGAVVYVRSDNKKIKKATDIAGSEQPEQFIYGGQPATGGELRMLLLFKMFESNVKTVLGYEGRGPARIAWEQGQSDIAYDSVAAYSANVKPLEEKGIAKPLLSFGVIRNGEVVKDPQLPDLPGPVEVYEAAFGKKPDNEAYKAYKAISVAAISLESTVALHAKAPAECKAELRAAWDRLVKNPEYIAAVNKQMGGYEALRNGDLDSLWQQLLHTDRDAINWLLDWVKTTYDVRLNTK